jgi:PAS domain S-box-containing protein
MKGDEGSQLTEVNREPDPDPGMTSGRLLVFLLPVLAAGAATTLVAIGAALAGWQREAMLITAAVVGCGLVFPTLAVVYREVADRRDTLRAVGNVQARVGGIVESAMDAVITIDELQRIVQFNAAAERVFRWPRGAVLGQRLDMLIPARLRAVHLQHIERFAQTAVTSRGMGRQAVLSGLRADGSEFPIEASISQHVEDEHKLFTVILRDVTERARSEEMLARSESRLRGILDSAMDAIITVDERQHIVLFNRAAEGVFRCSREEAVGAPLDWFIPERFRAGHRDLMRQFGAGGETSRRMGHARVVSGLRRNGEEFPIEASISQVEEHGQRFYTVILRDVTARARAEEALLRSKAEIQGLALVASTAREQEKSRIARELHDELGQALTALKIDVGWLRQHLGEPPPEVGRKLAAMQVLLDGTVAAARRISSDLRPLMLDDLGLTAAAEWLVHNFTNRTGLACDLALGAGDLDLPDPYATTVFRVLQECLTNVAKHAEASQVEVNLEREAGGVVLTVRDNGLGFVPEGPRSPNSYGIVGVRERAYLVGGEVAIESAPGRGTCVTLRVPLTTEAAVAR